VCENLPDSIIQSAANDMTLENIHMARYGSADSDPFYCYHYYRYYFFEKKVEEEKV
jgi:hypothetical protein